MFVNSIDAARRIIGILKHLKLDVYGLHAQMQQRQRLKNVDRFKAGATTVLVASDVAARGLDIPHVEHVVHYQVPRNPEVFYILDVPNSSFRLIFTAVVEQLELARRVSVFCYVVQMSPTLIKAYVQS